MINESRLRALIREAVQAADKQAILGIQKKGSKFSDLTRGLAMADEIASGRAVSYVRDWNDTYLYAAIGGNLTPGPSYKPDLFVVIHDGARPDRASLGKEMKPDDAPPTADQFLPAIVDQKKNPKAYAAADAAAQVLRDAYGGSNSYQYLLSKIRGGQLPAGDAATVAAAPTPPASGGPLAAAAADPDAGAAAAANLAVAFWPHVNGTPPTPADAAALGASPTSPAVTAAVSGDTTAGAQGGKGTPVGGQGTPDIPGWARRTGSKILGLFKGRKSGAKGGIQEPQAAAMSTPPTTWRDAWSQLTRIEKRLIAAYINENPQEMADLVVQALRDPNYNDQRVSRILSLPFTGAGLASLRFDAGSRLRLEGMAGEFGGFNRRNRPINVSATNPISISDYLLTPIDNSGGNFDHRALVFLAQASGNEMIGTGGMGMGQNYLDLTSVSGYISGFSTPDAFTKGFVDAFAEIKPKAFARVKRAAMSPSGSTSGVTEPL